jgi:hypothetical protein
MGVWERAFGPFSYEDLEKTEAGASGGREAHSGMTGDMVDHTPKLRHAEFHYLGTPACFLHFVVNKQPPSGGSMEILKGFPRPVGAVVSPHTWALS